MAVFNGVVGSMLCRSQTLQEANYSELNKRQTEGADVLAALIGCQVPSGQGLRSCGGGSPTDLVRIDYGLELPAIADLEK